MRYRKNESQPATQSSKSQFPLEMVIEGMQLKPGECKTILESDIRYILPHRGPPLFLDRVQIWGDRAVGYLEVTPDKCSGYCRYRQEDLMVRGTDLIDMAAQLLGMCGSLIPELGSKRRSFVLATTGPARFRSAVMAGEDIEMEITTGNIRLEKLPGDRYALRGRDFTVTSRGDKKATISSVLLVSTAFVPQNQTRYERTHKGKSS